MFLKSIVTAIASIFLFSSLALAASTNAITPPDRTDRQKDQGKMPVPPPRPKPDNDRGKDGGSRNNPKPAPPHPTDTL
jgi:hypothetical protein